MEVTRVTAEEVKERIDRDEQFTFERSVNGISQADPAYKVKGKGAATENSQAMPAEHVHKE